MLRIQTILVPIDFSDRSEPAIEHACNIAKQFGALPVFLHVVPEGPYPPAFVGAFPDIARWEISEESGESLRTELDRRVAQLAAGTAREVVVESGDPAEVIAQTAKKRNADLVVMPTAGTGIFRRLVLGSTTTKVLNDVDAPIMTGTHVEEIRAFAIQPYARIGCAVSGDESSGRTLTWAQGFADRYHSGPLTVIHAAPIPAIAIGSGPAPHVDLVAAAKQSARKKVNALLAQAGIEADTTVEVGWPSGVVPTVARKAKLDLLIIGRHSAEGIFSGLQSDTYGIVREAPCPVVSV